MAESELHDSVHGPACNSPPGRLGAHMSLCVCQEQDSRVYCGFSGGGTDMQVRCDGVNGQFVACALGALVVHALQGHVLGGEGNGHDRLIIRHVMGSVAAHDGFVKGGGDEAVMRERGQVCMHV